MADNLFQKIVIRILLAFIFLGLALFLPAGTIHYLYAWVYLGILFSSMILIMIYLLRYDRALLERRLKIGEREKPQKLIMGLAIPIYLGLFLIPGFDFRYGWSLAPWSVVIISDALFLIGYYLFFLVLKANSYAARTIEVEKDQKVISTGPYAVVRHPMYSALLLIIGFTPLCLGSYWGMILELPLAGILVLRILNEEKVLSEQLSGYQEYCLRTRYRLIPGIW